jgi:hypothetical protein
MVFGAIGVGFKSTLIRCSKGVDSDEYVGMVLPSGLPEGPNAIYGGEDWAFRQDGARCHTAARTVAALHKSATSNRRWQSSGRQEESLMRDLYWRPWGAALDLDNHGQIEAVSAVSDLSFVSAQISRVDALGVEFSKLGRRLVKVEEGLSRKNVIGEVMYCIDDLKKVRPNCMAVATGHCRNVA